MQGGDKVGTLHVGQEYMGKMGKEVFPLCAHGVKADPNKSTGFIPTPVLALRKLSAGVACWDGQTPAPTGVLHLFKATSCQQPSHHTISPSLKTATATLKSFLSPQADFVQALPHYQRAPQLYWST